MANETVVEMVALYLREHGYDGLLHEDSKCGCILNDLAPCMDGPFPKCRAGYKVACTPACAHEDTGHEPYEVRPGDWHVAARKEDS